jgi:hypothetical protein
VRKEDEGSGRVYIEGSVQRSIAATMSGTIELNLTLIRHIQFRKDIDSAIKVLGESHCLQHNTMHQEPISSPGARHS